HEWLERRDLRKVPLVQTVSAESIQAATQIGTPTIVNQGDWVKGKYGPLRQWFQQQTLTAIPNQTLTLAFEQIEELIEDALPPSAHQHRAWWVNDSTSSRQSEAWMTAGWAVDDVDLRAEIVRFKRTDIVFYQILWAELTARLTAERPGFSRTSKSFAQNYCSFSAGKSGLSYVWSIPSGRAELWTQLVIDTRSTDSEAAKRFFNQLESQKEFIELEFGGELQWDYRPDRLATRIYVTYPFRIINNAEDMEGAKQWAIDTIQRLADSMQPRIAELDSDQQPSTESSEPSLESL
ncbi:MAG TPA: DUF4268 domain-containing protein, partial [Promineifilum sp.]|nr:DUF4268 domain-containing protein [Promineifilum sp.]